MTEVIEMEWTTESVRATINSRFPQLDRDARAWQLPGRRIRARRTLNRKVGRPSA